MDRGKMRNLQCEDKRQVLFAFLQSACRDFPDYSSGDILYAALRGLAKKHGQSVSFLRAMTDEELFEEVDYRISMEYIDVAVEEDIEKRNRKKEK